MGSVGGIMNELTLREIRLKLGMTMDEMAELSYFKAYRSISETGEYSHKGIRVVKTTLR